MAQERAYDEAMSDQHVAECDAAIERLLGTEAMEEHRAIRQRLKREIRSGLRWDHDRHAANIMAARRIRELAVNVQSLLEAVGGIQRLPEKHLIPDVDDPGFSTARHSVGENALQ